MTPTEALRHLLKVVRGLDLPDDHPDKPTEEEYQLALVAADRALQANDEAGLVLRDGSAVDLRAPWVLPA